MSAFIYAGSMQYVAIDLLTGGASLISAALMTLMVNARHLFYGVSMLEKYRGMGAAKPYLIFALTAPFVTVVIEQWLTAEGWVPALIGVLVTGMLHVWKRNTLLSIIGGTVCYMLLVQLAFWN